jgi:hypothetical protein
MIKTISAKMAPKSKAKALRKPLVMLISSSKKKIGPMATKDKNNP